MADLGEEVAKQLEIAQVQEDEESHRADADHLDDPHGLLTKPGLKGLIGKGKDTGKASNSQKE